MKMILKKMIAAGKRRVPRLLARLKRKAFTAASPASSAPRRLSAPAPGASAAPRPVSSYVFHVFSNSKLERIFF